MRYGVLMFMSFGTPVMAIAATSPPSALTRTSPAEMTPLPGTPAPIEPAGDEAAGAAAAARAGEVEDPSARAAALAEALALLPRPTRFRGLILYGQAEALANVERIAESRAALEEAARLLPDVPVVQLVLGQLLVQANDVVRGATLIAAAVETAPELIAILQEEMAVSTLRRLRYARADALRDRLLKALVDSGYTNAHPELAGEFAAEVIRSRLGRGDRAGAVALLRLFGDPNAALLLIVGRRYESIWTDLDAWAGRDLQTQRLGIAAAARAAFAADPGHGSRLRLARALRGGGDGPAAAALLDAALADPAGWDADDEREGIIRIAIWRARWQWQDGDLEAALATYARLLAVTPLAKYPTISNLAVNYADRLSRIGRRVEALRVLDDLEAGGVATSRGFEGDGAALWFAAIRACVADGAAGAAARARIAAGRLVNRRAYRESLACRGETAALIADTLDQLAGSAYDDATVYSLRLREIDPYLGSDTFSQSFRALDADPRIRARLDEISRPIPAGYLAAARGWRD